MSSRAYEQQVFSGAVGRQRQLVLQYVARSGTATGSEVDTDLGLRGGHVRLTELHKMGLIVLCPERACRVTGKRVQNFKVNGPAPEQLPDLSQPNNLQKLTTQLCQDMGASTAALGVLIAQLEHATGNLEDVPSGCEEVLRTLEIAAEAQLWTIRCALAGRTVSHPRHDT